MTKLLTRAIGPVLAATLAILACGPATGAQNSAVGAGRDQSARLRQLNEALYRDSATPDATPARPSRLEQLDEMLYPEESEITPRNNLTAR